MNSMPVRVVEYWQMLAHDMSRAGEKLMGEALEKVMPKWERDPELEIEIIRPEKRTGGNVQYSIRPLNPKDRDFHNISSAPTQVAPFSHATESDGWVMLTGQMPTIPGAPDAPLPEGVAAQTARVMENLKLVLDGVGLDLSHVLQCRCFLTEFERDYATFNDTYKSFFPADRLPARTTVGVTALAVGALVEIDCVARRP